MIEQEYRDWRVTRENGEVFALSCIPPATASQMREQYPGCVVDAIAPDG